LHFRNLKHRNLSRLESSSDVVLVLLKIHESVKESQPIDPRPKRLDRRIDSPYRVELLPNRPKPQPNTP
jgi:hypothetical protein